MASAESNPVTAVDLFCGAGGLSTALALACEELGRDVDLVAVNHWTKAIESHEQNHPWARHLNAKVEEIHPPNVVDADEVDILIAAPECTHFSSARGGKPVKEQQRASPWHVVDWLEKLNVQNFLVENVRELESWGPVDEDGKPSRNGAIFDAWIDALHALGYSVDWRVLNAADYGDATSRKRLFIVGRKDKRAEFPTPTHSQDGGDDTEPWRPASEILDWSDPGESIWGRSRPLVNNTMQRIAEGIRRHCHDDLAPFADAVAELGKADVAAMQEDVVDAAALPDVLDDREGPFLVQAPAVAADGGATGEPAYVLGQQSNAMARSVEDRPLPTIATRGAIGLYQPETFVLPRNGAFRGLHSNATYTPDSRPLHTVTASNHDGHLVRPYLVPYQSEREGQRPRVHDVDAPFPTITATGSDPYLTSPYLIEYYGEGRARDVNDPLPTVTTKDRFALILPDLFPWGLDIRFRMLEPRELAAAMGFPDGYELVGNKTERTKQIGNAVPVNLGKALCNQILTGDAPSLDTFTPEVPADD